MTRMTPAEQLLAVAIAKAKLVEEAEEVFRQEDNIRRMEKYLAIADGKLKHRAQVKLNKMVRANKSRTWHAFSRYNKVRFSMWLQTSITQKIPTAEEIFAELREEKANANKEKTEPLYSQRVPDAGGL